MVSRRAVLRLAGATVAGTSAGCGSEPPPTASHARSKTPPTAGDDAEPSPTGGAADVWTPVWRRTVPEENVLGLTPGRGDELYASLSDETGPSAVARLAPHDGEIVWHTSFEGEPVEGSFAGARPDSREHWGATVGSEAVYSVHGGDDWTALHALDRQTGEVRWSDRKSREFVVHGVVSDTVVATAGEFARPPTDGPATAEPRESTLLAYDARTGAVRWSRSFAGVADVAVGEDAIHVAAGDRVVVVGLDGDERSRFEGDRPARAVRVSDSQVFYVTGTYGAGSTVHGLERGGTPEWMLDVAASEFLVDGGRLYVGGDVLAAIDPDGTVAWRVDRGSDLLLVGPAGNVVLARAFRSAGAGTEEVVTAYGTGGRHRFAFDPPGRRARPRAATAGTVVVEGVDDGPAVWDVDSADGGRRRRHHPDAAPFTITAAGERVFAGDARSTILAFEA